MAATSKNRQTARRLTVIYDRPVDVLVISVGIAEPVEGDGLPRGVEIDYSLDTGNAVAAKVIGFQRNGWLREIGALSRLMGNHLSIDPIEIAAAVESAVN